MATMCPQRRHAFVVLLALLFSCFGADSQDKGMGQDGQSPSAILTPDSGTSERGLYTDEFFGFAYRYPDAWKIQPPLPQKVGGPKIYTLLYVILPAKQFEFTALAVTAREAAPSLTAEEYVANENSSRNVSARRPPQHLFLGNTSFLRFDGEEKTKTSPIHIAELVSIQKGYVLEFLFVDGAKKSRVSEFADTIRTLKFDGP